MLSFAQDLNLLKQYAIREGATVSKQANVYEYDDGYGDVTARVHVFCTHVLSARSTRNGSLTGQTGALRRFGLFII